MSTEEFNEYFVGEVETRKDLRQLDESAFCQVDLENWLLNGNELSFHVNLGSEIISVSGVLEKGYRGESYLNLNHGVVSDGYKLLLGELYLGTGLDTSLLFQKMEGKNIKLYLVKNKEVLLVEVPLIFEVDVPISLTIENKEYNILWFLDIVEPSKVIEVETTSEVIEELGLTPNVMRTPSTPTDWINPKTYTCEYYIGSDYFVTQSLPYVRYTYTNVTPLGLWEVNFQIAEHTKLNGTVYRAATNPIRYVNVELKVACGAKTKFSRQYWKATAVDDSIKLSPVIVGVGSKIKTIAMKKVFASVPASASITETISWLKEMTKSEETVTLGTGREVLCTDYTRAIGTQLKNLTFYKNTSTGGHMAGISADLMCISAGNSNVVSTNGVLDFSIDVYDDRTATKIATIKPSAPIILDYTGKP